MAERIEDNKYVELTYQVVDKKSGDVLTLVEFPLSYVHGANDIMGEQVTNELHGRSAGDTIEVPVDCNQLYGPRDENLVITDLIENVPEEYREVGTTIVMESESGATKNFIVTRIDDKTLTIDGNNPLCGREVIFKLEILTVRDASPEEIEAGGALDANPDLHQILNN